MKRIKFLVSLVIVLFVSSVQTFSQKTYQPNWESIDSRPVPSWFQDARFGIFIHWGLYSVPAYSPTARDSVGVYDRYAEHYWRRWKEQTSTQHYFQDFHNRVYGPDFKYQDFVSRFKAELFNPDEWAKLFKESGARYVVLTSKHHEGFALWPSKYSWNWNAMDVGPHRDLLGDLTKSVRREGLRMGYYYSLLEWYNPFYTKETIGKYVDDHMIPQMKELVVNYKPDILWTDGEWDYPSEVLKSTQFLQWLYNDSPVKDNVVVNDRWGKETRGKHGGFYTTEYDLVNNDNAQGKIINHPWEECRGIGGSFGYNRMENLEDYSGSEDLVHILVDNVARGGNLLLNIGPTADGRIPVIMQERLLDMGAWLSMNGEAIYGTRKWEDAPAVTPETTIYYTRKGNDLYALVTRWQDSPVTIGGIRQAKSVILLGYNGKVKFSLPGNNLVLTPPVLTPANNSCRYAWVFKVQDAFN